MAGIKKRKHPQPTTDISCLKCQEIFKSIDTRRNRLCKKCAASNAKTHALRTMSPRRLDGRSSVPESEESS